MVWLATFDSVSMPPLLKSFLKSFIVSKSQVNNNNITALEYKSEVKFPEPKITQRSFMKHRGNRA